MERDIKFRAWDKESKKMYKVDKLIMYGGGEVGADMISRERECINGWDKQLEFMQYTGLKDKNGKEMYEGDIVKVNGKLMEVFFKDGYFGWGKEHSGAYSFDPFGAEQLEIIGNIYENPNLIKDNK